jgi:hypothetical protein
MESASSANCGSSASRGKSEEALRDEEAPPWWLAAEEARNDVREEGRSGVVGLDTPGERERVRCCEVEVEGGRAWDMIVAACV